MCVEVRFCKGSEHRKTAKKQREQALHEIRREGATVHCLARRTVCSGKAVRKEHAAKSEKKNCRESCMKKKSV